MRYGRLLFSIFVLLSTALPAFNQRSVEDVVVTGDISKIILCHQEGDVWSYSLTVKLHTKNIGTRPVIISDANALTDYYKFADTLSNLETAKYAHIGWVTSGSSGDPKTVPEIPVKPFKVVAPGSSLDINVNLGVIVIGGLKAGPAYLQFVAENWPAYSKEYTAKIRSAWSAQGNLWAHSLHSEPIPFVVPADLKVTSCP